MFTLYLLPGLYLALLWSFAHKFLKKKKNVTTTTIGVINYLLSLRPGYWVDTWATWRDKRDNRNNAILIHTEQPRGALCEFRNAGGVDTFRVVPVSLDDDVKRKESPPRKMFTAAADEEASVN